LTQIPFYPSVTHFFLCFNFSLFFWKIMEIFSGKQKNKVTNMRRERPNAFRE